MEAAEAVAALDRQIAAHGQPVSFRRASSTLSARGFVRGYKPEQLVGLITQADRQVVVSPTTLGSYGVPQAEDGVLIDGEFGTVKAAEPVHVGDELVRVNLRVTMS